MSTIFNAHEAMRLMASNNKMLMHRIAALEAENVALREDKAWLDDMERLGISLICRKSTPSSVANKWVAKRDDSYPAKNVRAAIDAARKEDHEQEKGD